MFCNGVNTRAYVSHKQGDACHLEESLGQFDVVLAANLLCRLPEPVLFITRLKSLVNMPCVCLYK